MSQRRVGAQDREPAATLGLELIRFRRHRPTPPPGHPWDCILGGGRVGEWAGADSVKDI